VTVKFDLPGSYEVKVVPDKIPSIYNGDKTVVYGLLMDKSDDKERDGLMCKAILSGDIVGKEFKFEIPFELSGRQAAEEDVSVIHQLAAKVMIQEWQDDGEPLQHEHNKEIAELSCDASVVSKYTAYVAVDEAQNKPVSGSMQNYELTAYRLLHLAPGRRKMSSSGSTSTKMATFRCAYSVPVQAEVMALNSKRRAKGKKSGRVCSLLQTTVSSQYADSPAPSTVLLSSSAGSSAPPPLKQSGPSFIVSLQQFDGSWLLNDKLAGVVSKSVEELKSCCPVSCDVTMMANIWATLVVIELLKKKYPSMLEELELVIMKAEQWVGKQALPSGVDLVVLRDGASKVV